MSAQARPATVGDLDAIADLDHDAFQLVPWSRQMVVEGLDGIVPGLSYLVAEDEGRFVGYAAVSVVGDIAELQRVAVLPEERRGGAGRALVTAVRDLARDAGATRLLLEVHDTNAPAQALYADAGFAELARRPRYFRDGSDALVLELTLDGGDQ